MWRKIELEVTGKVGLIKIFIKVLTKQVKIIDTYN